MRKGPLAVIATHPVQYQAPVFRAVQEEFGVPVHVIYGSDFSIAGYFDKEFRSSFAWDTRLVVEDDEVTFLSRVAQGGAKSFEEVSAKGVGRALDACAPGAVLLTGYQPRFHIDAFFQAWRRGLPILFRAETTDHAVSRSSWKSRARDAFLSFLYSRCEKLLPIGKRSYEHYRRLGCAEDTLVFSPYAVDTAPFRPSEADRRDLRPAARAELGLSEDDTVILYSGKLSRRKGTHLLVDAVRRLPKEVWGAVTLVFLGAGQELEALQSQAAAAPAVPARFVGFQNQSALSRYYHAADLLVLPSIQSETWGLVVNEALHHGVPCVVSDGVGCAPDLVEPGATGEIAAAGSLDSLAAAIQRCHPLLHSPQTRSRCRDQVSGYTVLKAAEGIARSCESLAPRFQMSLKSPTCP